jgi:hypothetical protein
MRLSSEELNRGEAICAAFVQNTLDDYADGRRGAEFTLFGKLLKGMAKSALELWTSSTEDELRAYQDAEQKRVEATISNVPPEAWTPDEFRAWHQVRHDINASLLSTYLNEARELVADLRYASSDVSIDRPDRDEDPKLDFWRGTAKERREVRKGFPLLDRRVVEDLASRYLASKLRNPLYDKVLLDMFCAVEEFGFKDEVLNPRRDLGAPTGLRAYTRGMNPILSSTITIAVLGGAAILISFLVFWLFRDGSAGRWIGGGVWVLAGLLAAWELAVLPFAWASWSKGRRDIERVTQAMAAVRAALIGPAVCSASHVEQLMRRAAYLGVVWPSPAYVLLEDVQRRGGVLGE